MTTPWIPAAVAGPSIAWNTAPVAGGAVQLAGTSAGKAVVSGSLSGPKQLAGISAGKATVSVTTLAVRLALAGTSTGRAVVAGRLAGPAMLAGISRGKATVLTTIGVRYAVTAQSNGLAHVTGNVVVSRGMTGQSHGLAYVTVAAPSLVRRVNLSATSHGTASVSVTLTIQSVVPAYVPPKQVMTVSQPGGVLFG